MSWETTCRENIFGEPDLVSLPSGIQRRLQLMNSTDKTFFLNHLCSVMRVLSKKTWKDQQFACVQSMPCSHTPKGAHTVDDSSHCLAVEASCNVTQCGKNNHVPLRVQISSVLLLDELHTFCCRLPAEPTVLAFQCCVTETRLENYPECPLHCEFMLFSNASVLDRSLEFIAEVLHLSKPYISLTKVSLEVKDMGSRYEPNCSSSSELLKINNNLNEYIVSENIKTGIAWLLEQKHCIVEIMRLVLVLHSLDDCKDCQNVSCILGFEAEMKMRSNGELCNIFIADVDMLGCCAVKGLSMHQRPVLWTLNSETQNRLTEAYEQLDNRYVGKSLFPPSYVHHISFWIVDEAYGECEYVVSRALTYII